MPSQAIKPLRHKRVTVGERICIKTLLRKVNDERTGNKTDFEI